MVDLCWPTAGTPNSPRLVPFGSARWLAAACLLSLAACSADSASDDADGGPTGPAGTTPTESNLRVAFIGDQGLGPDSVAVLELIRDEGADFVIHSGDFDYVDDPDAWDDQITGVLGDDYPYFANVGNHDVAEWEGYRAKLEQRLAKIDGVQCSGAELGVQSACTYRGLFFILSGVGTWGFVDHRAFVDQALAADDSIWRVCTWHVTRADFQVGSKGNEAPLDVYQRCAAERAFIVNGHEHSYSRTLSLSDVGNAAAGYGATGTPDEMWVTEGSAFVAVSGLGGVNARDYHADEHDDDTWWAAIYAEGRHLTGGQDASDFNYTFGALFVDFHVDSDPRKARGYFKNIAGEVIDEFSITTDRRLP